MVPVHPNEQVDNNGLIGTVKMVREDNGNHWQHLVKQIEEIIYIEVTKGKEKKVKDNSKEDKHKSDNKCENQKKIKIVKIK